MVMAADYPFIDVLWSMIIFFFWVIWIWIVITVLIDIFRRHDIGGFSKAAWVVFVVILPWLGVLVYLIAQHDGMRERSVKQAQAQQQQFDDYVRDAAGGGVGRRDREGQGAARLGRDQPGGVRGAEGEGARVASSSGEIVLARGRDAGELLAHRRRLVTCTLALEERAERLDVGLRAVGGDRRPRLRGLDVRRRLVRLRLCLLGLGAGVGGGLLGHLRVLLGLRRRLLGLLELLLGRGEVLVLRVELLGELVVQRLRRGQGRSRREFRSLSDSSPAASCSARSCCAASSSCCVSALACCAPASSCCVSSRSDRVASAQISSPAATISSSALTQIQWLRFLGARSAASCGSAAVMGACSPRHSGAAIVRAGVARGVPARAPRAVAGTQ